MPAMSRSEIDEFLSKPRIGVLCTADLDGSPNGVPVWFEWDGEQVRMFSSASHRKIARLENDPRASLLVAREVGEPEAWVAVDGVVAIGEEGVVRLMERLAARYWVDEDPAVAAAHAETVESWRQAAAQLRVLTIVPEAIRSYHA
ncbi:MAG: pyridoxamine 5'-phosphate oxidase family protein [Holophagales bacterium]|nr:pyridoxamine 5'-phosphate oxidase family protein [Holophagales bacterium]MYG30048.1 pyridoxamine 5'-phosphate oxidase family protein [Holophagales bacterium]MYI78727.1 pyridoxamine 5'-phosphate oxidase family protein [Holophagales bacterium]